MVYAISYDLNKPGQDYSGLYEEIKGCGAWWHYLDSTWLVDTKLDASSIWKKLKSHTDKNDTVLVIKVTRDYSGWLTDEAWEWLKNRV